MNIVIMKWKGFLETITSYDATWKKNSLQLQHEMSFVRNKILETFIAYSNIQRDSGMKMEEIYILKISFLCEEKKAGTV